MTTYGGGFMGAGVAGEIARRRKTKCAAEATAKADGGIAYLSVPAPSWGRCARARPTAAICSHTPASNDDDNDFGRFATISSAVKI